MTTTSGLPGSSPASEPAATAAPDPAGRRSRAALAGAAVLVTATVALVLVFGVARPPALEALADAPLPGLERSIAWTSWDEDGLCLHTATPDGRSSRVACNLEPGELVGWDDRGLLLTAWRPDPGLLVLDPASGEVVTSVADVVATPPASEITARRVDGNLEVRDHHLDVVVWRVAAPEAYHVTGGTRAPDDRFSVLLDASRRLLVVPADGSEPPRVWVAGVEGGGLPVWEGQVVPAPQG